MRSKAELRLCIGACPSQLAKDCKGWLGELEPELARLTVVVQSRDGTRLDGERVFVDGVERRSGEVLELDPGKHEIRAEAPGHRRRTAVVELDAGSRSTRTVALDRGAGDAGATPDLAGPLTVAGAGLAVLTVAAALAIVGHLDVSDMRGDEAGCAPSCPPDRVERVRDLWTAGAVLASAGGAAVVGASIWLGIELTPQPDTNAGLVPGGAVLELRGRF